MAKVTAWAPWVSQSQVRAGQNNRHKSCCRVDVVFSKNDDSLLAEFYSYVTFCTTAIYRIILHNFLRIVQIILSEL